MTRPKPSGAVVEPRQQSSDPHTTEPARSHSGWMARVARPLLVLVADDDDESRGLSASFLMQCGFRVLEAKNGAIALDMASVHDPDVIVMDLDMPVMGGVEAIERLKSDDRTLAIPVVVLSGSVATNHFKVERAGCAAYLVKPCDPVDLESVVRGVAALASLADPLLPR